MFKLWEGKDWQTFPGIYPKKVFRFRPSTSNHFLTEMDAFINKREIYFVGHTFLNDLAELKPVYIKSDILEIRNYIRTFQKRFGRQVSLDGNPMKTVMQVEGWTKREFKIFSGDTYDAARLLQSRVGVVLRRLREATHVACFITDWQSPNMWGYYTDKKGVCIEYDVDEKLMSQSAIGLEPIHYSEERPVVSTIEMMKYSAGLKHFEEAPDFFDSDALKETNRKLALQKWTKWQHETEWRLNYDALGYAHVPALIPRCVILGANMPDQRIEELRKSIGPSIPFERVRLSQKSYALERIPTDF